MNRLLARFTWRGLALGMTAACGGLLMRTSPLGGLILLAVAVFLGVLTQKWVRT
jgi:hypothetical protein